MQKVWPLTKIESNEGISHGVWLASPVIEYGRLVHHLAISGFFFFFFFNMSTQEGRRRDSN
jgi:hypothetical protein